MSETMIEKVADALRNSFKETVAAGAERGFDQTGVLLPAQQVWERYARAAMDAIRPELQRIVEEVDGRFDYAESAVSAIEEAIDAALTPTTPS